MKPVRRTFHLTIWFASLLSLASIPFMLHGQAQGPGDKFRRVDNAISGEYIVVLNDDFAGPRGALSIADVIATDLAASYGGALKYIYKDALNGFSVQMNEAAAVELSEHPAVEFVVENGLVFVTDSQANPWWGLDRIDQRDRPLDNRYNYNTTGLGVNVYIIDTGIRYSHIDFDSRARPGVDFAPGGDGTGRDCHGHGTHVAGIAGGRRLGVAKDATLYSVRVMGIRGAPPDPCSGAGELDNIISGVNWVTANRRLPAVANMSLGGGPNAALDLAVRNSIAAGVTYVVSAGNNNVPVTNQSPAAVAQAITVGATQEITPPPPPGRDERWLGPGGAFGSNFGPLVDLFAPGGYIYSASHLDDQMVVPMSGTSMAAPHVAGVAARYLQTTPAAPPAVVEGTIVNNATRNRIAAGTIGAGSPNLLLYASFTAAPPPPGCLYNVAPLTVSIGPSGGPGSVNVVTLPAVGCPWAAISHAPWITITAGGGFGTGVATYTVAVNPTGSARTGWISVAGRIVTVTQTAVPPGTLQGTVTNASTGAAVAGATVQAVGAGSSTTTTNAAGQYSMSLAPGTYTVTVSASGFVTQNRPNVVINTGAANTQNFALQVLRGTLSGPVRNATTSAPIVGATVQATGPESASTTTNGSGQYQLSLLPGTYTVTASAPGFVSQTVPGILITGGSPNFQGFFLQPLSQVTLSVSRTGAGAGTVSSDPIGIDCGTACSASYDPGTVVTLTAVPDAESIFAFWRGPADCADGVVTMTSNLMCDAIFDARPSVSFDFAAALPVGTPYAVAIADLNGDWIPDLAVTQYNAEAVSVLFGDGTGGFAPGADYNVQSRPRELAIVDLNGDGALDLAVVNLQSGTVSVLLNDGGGGFGSPNNLPVGDSPVSVAVGDFNADGVVDLAVAHLVASGTISVLLGDGTGGFGSATSFLVGRYPYSVAAGDLNADGALDLVAANDGGNTVSVLFGDGTGAFGPHIQLLVQDNPRSVRIVDLNGDGNLDLAVAVMGDNMVAILLGDGMGGFAPPVNLLVGAEPYALATDDLNGDGLPDLAVANWSYGGRVSIVLGDPTGAFGSAGNAAVIGVNPSSMAITDLNGDGKPDLVLTYAQNQTVHVLLNTTPWP